MRIERASALADVCAAVCTALGRHGTLAVCTGGGAAALYAPELPPSDDLDFVAVRRGDERAALLALRDLGYRRRGQSFRHGENRYSIEFAPGPLAIGTEPLARFATLAHGPDTLNVLDATDSVRDRLLNFYEWRDPSALAAALAVAKRNVVDMTAIARWSRRRRAAREFREFVELLAP